MQRRRPASLHTGEKTMTLVVVDVESDGPVPPLYSMICFGAVIVDKELKKTFYGQTRPISEKIDKEAAAISGFTREQHERFADPRDTMRDFHYWLNWHIKDRLVMISDNIAYDWQWINYYFHKYHGNNPFGWSGRRIGDIWGGAHYDLKSKWTHLRKTKHTHHPVDDAMGNAEALLHMHEIGIKGIIK